MSHSVLAVYVVFGPEVTFRDNESPGSNVEIPEIGLYNVINAVTGGQEWALIYAEDEIRGSDVGDLKYTTGFLAKGGIGEISESGCFKHGGGVIQSRQTQIWLNNTAQLKSVFEMSWISLFGRMVYIVEYFWEEEGGSVTPNPLFAGRVEEVQWNETELRLSAVPNIEMMRRANVMIEGLPVTIGELEYGINMRCKNDVAYRHCANVIDMKFFHNERMDCYEIEIITDMDMIEYGTPENYKEFLLNNYGAGIGLPGSIRPAFCIANGVKYGTQIRNIKSAPDRLNSDHTVLSLLLYVPVNRKFAPSKIDIVIFKSIYYSDGWENWVGQTIYRDYDVAYFVNKNKLIQGVYPYTQRLPMGGQPWAPITDSLRGQNRPPIYKLGRELITDELIDSQMNKINSFEYKNATHIDVIRDDEWKQPFSTSQSKNLDKWKIDKDEWYNMYQSVLYPGVYSTGTFNILEYREIDKSVIVTNPGISSSHGVSGSIFDCGMAIYAFEIILPEAVPYNEYDDAYLMLIFSQFSYPANNPVRIYVRYMDEGHPVDILTLDSSEMILSNHIAPFRSPAAGHGILDDFIFDSKIVPSPDKSFFTGYFNMPVKVTNEQTKVAFMLKVKDYEGDIQLMVASNSYNILFRKKVDVSNYLLMPTNGRLFASDWGNGRKKPTDYINNPIDAIEHFRRLADWSETSETKEEAKLPDDWSWGKAYAPDGFSALIDTASFDHPSLNEAKGLKIGGQILKESEANNDQIVKELCEDFFIVSQKTIPTKIQSNDLWTNNYIVPPYESVSCLYNPAGTPEPITFKELLSYGDIREPGANDIFCEPVIKYKYIEGMGYSRTMAITGVATNEKWEPHLNLTPGFRPDHGERIWEECKDLFRRYRAFAEMPAKLSEQRWVQNYRTALWKIRAALYWQQCSRTQIVVPWSIGRRWDVGKHINLSLPHVRNGTPLLCVCESVKKAKHVNRVTCDLIYLHPVNPFRASTIINETGNADITIDESGDRSAAIAEAGETL